MSEPGSETIVRRNSCIKKPKEKFTGSGGGREVSMRVSCKEIAGEDTGEQGTGVQLHKDGRYRTAGKRTVEHGGKDIGGQGTCRQDTSRREAGGQCTVG